MTYFVCVLSKEQLKEHWDKVEWRIDATPELERFYSKKELISLMEDDRIQVWSAGHDLVLFTMVIDTPLGPVFQILFAHGTGLEKHWEELKEKFHLFAHMCGCKKIEVFGRKGWAKVFKNEKGFKTEFVVYSADVEPPQMH